jgi:thioredoxin reductase (NADPH)
METNEDHLYDALIIGGGPAGLTAAIYLARARYRVLIIEKDRFGGQINITAKVVNYPGVEIGSGEEIAAAMRRQAQRFGAEFLLAQVDSVEMGGEIKRVKTSRGEYEAFALIIATGAHPRTVGFKGEEEFKGRGVAYCATCDGEFFTGLDVFVVGGGFAAATEAVFLAKYARTLTILIRGGDFSCAKAEAEPAKNHKKIKVCYHTVVDEVSGDTALRYARFRNTLSGETWEYRPAEGETFGIFVFAGYQPASELVQGMVELDEAGYILTDTNKQTNIPGVYAAGDVCVKHLRQMVTAVGDGAVAATELERYAAAMQKATGRVPRQSVNRLPIRAARPVRPAGNALPGTAGAPEQDGFFSSEIRSQMEILFEKMERPLILRVFPDERPVSLELWNFLEELSAMSDKLSVQTAGTGEQEAPCIRICREDGTYTGIAFHGVPGGHEFHAFALGLYNAAGPGQSLDPGILDEIRAINRPRAMKILVSLSCTMCPELVIAAQRIALENPLISADVYDLSHFQELKDQYQVMSVPCLVLNNSLSFGKKNIPQLLEFLVDAG